MGLKGKRIFVHVFGCRTSLCEGEYIAGSLQSLGAEISEELSGKIDAAVIVTCSVTQEADRKCRQLIRRVKSYDENIILAVCGCWGQGVDTETAQNLGVDILAGSRGKNILPEKISDMLTSQKNFLDLRTQNIFEASQWEDLPLKNFPVMHSRAFMKIQDGCNHFCSYCIIPFMRGRPVSRPEDEIINEIYRLLDEGVKEIIFTGIHLGIYGRDINSNLAELIKKVSRIEKLKRFRLGSLEPFCADDDLLRALSDCEAFCKNLHLPLQSGDDEILKSMRRGYNSSEFLKVCENAKKFLGDDLHISSDILVGFPGESEAAFSHTLDIMKASGLGRVHVFPYSERKGTTAANLSEKVSHTEKISRTSRAISLGRELLENFTKKFLGREVEILIEKNNHGHTREYLDAECFGNNNEILKVKALHYENCRLECVRVDV